MKCPKDCPVLAGFEETIVDLRSSLDDLRSLRNRIYTAKARNEALALQLAGLPNGAARNMLLEARSSLHKADIGITNAVVHTVNAIPQNEFTAELVQTGCPGEPHYIDNPARPGSMILTCASIRPQD